MACQKIESPVDLIVEAHIPDSDASAEMRIQGIEPASLPMELMPRLKTGVGISRAIVVTEVIVAGAGTNPQIPVQLIYRDDHLWSEPTGSIPGGKTSKTIRSK